MNKQKVFLLVFLLFMISNVSAFVDSNESIQAKDAITQAKLDIVSMQEREIPTLRVNEILEDAVQLYVAQSSLSNSKTSAKFDLVLEYALKVSEIKELSFEAKDELNVFISFYESSSKSLDLSEMETFYSDLLISFQEERFEDTISSIEEGYGLLSDIQSSQTALNLFYDTTSKTIKNFFIENWKKMLIGIAIILSFLVIFWAGLRRLFLRRKKRYLFLRKNTIKNLIKDLQRDYFSRQNISETEYHVRLKKFGELVRDIDRELSLLKEGVIKLATSKAKLTKSNPKAKFWFFRKEIAKTQVSKVVPSGKNVVGEVGVKVKGESVKRKVSVKIVKGKVKVSKVKGKKSNVKKPVIKKSNNKKVSKKK